MESPFDIIKNIGKNIVKTGKQAVTNLYDNGFIGISGIKTQGGLVPNFPQIFNPSSKLGIAENTIKGFPQAALTVGTTLKKAPGVIKDMMFPPRPFDEQVVSPMDYMTRSLRSPEEASMIEQKYKAQQPTVKEKLLALPKWGAEIGSGIGNLVGPALADKPLFTKDSFLGRIGVPGAGKTLTEVANTRFGGKLASGGGAVEDFAVPKNIRENVAMRGADLATALPVGAAKAVQSFKKVAELIAKSTDAKVIANGLKNVGIADAVIPRISSILANETDPKVVEKVIQKMDNLYRGVAPEVAETISPDDIQVMKLFINDIRQAKDVPFEGQRIISKDGKYAYDLMEKWNINTEQDANKIATIFEDILTGNRKVTATLLAKPKPIDDIIFQAKAIVKDGKKVVTEAPQPRDTIGRFDVKPKPTLSEELMAKMSKPKPVVPVYQGEKDLTVKTLEKLKGRSTVSKQFISDLTNSADLKQSERDLIREALANEGDTVNVADFAKKVKDETLPLKTKSSDLYTPEGKGKNSFKMVEEGDFTPKYEGVSLPDDIRGKVGNYRENIYESPIATSAGDVHFNDHTKNYFGHTRIEDMADNKTRRVIEVQSDLYQKGRLDSEFEKATLSRGKESRIKRSDEGTTYDATKDFNKLQQYNDPTAHFRMLREEVKKAAQDGKTKLQFPTGETAMKIEGLGSRNNFELYDEFGENLPLEEDMLKVGKEIKQGSTNWIITNVLGDGKFVAVQKNTLDRLELQHGKIKDLSKIVGGATETFDISGKVDTNNPIYKFYEKEVGRYLANKYKAKLVTDAQGVKWWEVDINPAMGKAPVEAFGAVGGIEQDEEGNITFDPLKAGLGIAGFTAYNKIKKIMPVDRLIAEGKIKINRVGTRDVYSYKKGNMWQRARDESSAIRAVTKDPTLKPSLPENLVEKKIAIEIQKETIKDNPLNSLIKYTAKTGENKGRLPEVLGNATSKGFGKKGDDIIQAITGRNMDSEVARQELETFMQRKQQVLAQEKAVNEEIKAFKATQTEIKPKVTPKPEAPHPSSPVRAITGSTGEVRSLEKMAEQSATREILDPQLRKSSSLPKIIEKTATNVKSKVNALDYLRTPDKVLKKIGLENNAIEIRRGYDAYVKELPKNIDKITKWSKRVSKEGNVKIFKYLDGEAIDLNPEELKVANEIKTWLAQWANRLGLPQDNRIANYITHLFDDQLIAKEFDEDLAKIIADKVPSSVYDPFLLKRLGAKGYKQDTWSALDAYVKRGTRKVHMDAPLSNLEDASRGLEESQWNYVKRFADRVNMRPTEFDNIIDNGIKSLIGYRFGQRPVTTIARTLRQATYRGMLGLNVGSALRNLSQGINTYAKLGEKYTVVGYSKLFSPKNLAELAEEGVLSPGFIQDRAMSSTKKFMEKADKVLFALFDTAEKINRGAAYFGAKAKGIAEGMSEAKAIEYAKKIVRDTQFAFGSIDTPVGMSSDIVKTLTQFQTFTTKQIEFLAEMAKNKEYAGLIRYALSGLAFVYTVGQAFGMEPKDLIPVYRLGTPPSLKLPWEGVKAIAGAKDKYGGERTTGEKITDVAETLPGYIPAGIQAKKTIQGAKAIQEGGVFDRANRMQFEGPETKAQQIQAILFGKYASEKAKSYFDKAEGKELEKIKPVYDQVQKLKEMGDMAGGQAIIDSLTDEEYEMYKKVKSSETTKKNAEIKKSMYPVYNDVQKLKTAGKTAEAQKIIDGLTDAEYKAYQSIKKDKESKSTTPEYDQNIVSRYVEAVVKDPSNALKALFTKEKLGKVEGNLVELQRFYGVPFTDVGGSQEYKKKRMTEMGLDWDTEQKNYKLEHIVPVSAGGSNTDSNLVPVNNTEHNLYTPVDIALGEAVKQGKITRKRATELARGLKVTKILSIEDIIKLLE